MFESFDRADSIGVPDESHGWHAIISAWLLAFIFAALFATAGGFASRHYASPRDSRLAGAVIPRHDPSFPGPDDVAASDWLERVRAEAYGAN
jgi:hypothetical protein